MKKDNKQSKQDDVVSQVQADGEPEINLRSDQLDQLAKELSEFKEQFDLQNSQLKRAVADYQNLEKRVTEDRSALTIWVGAKIISSILPTLDHLDKVLSGAGEAEKQSPWFRGVEIAVQQLKNKLREQGLEEIDAKGSFDPSQHEAIDTAEGKENEIVEVAEKGYTLNGKVLKPAKVVVGKSSFAKASEDEKGAS